MKHRSSNRYKTLALVGTLALTLAAQFASHTAATTSAKQTQTGCVEFRETGYGVCGLFLEYWNEHGGLAQQGYAITTPMSEVSPTDGKIYTVQYFERAVFELHPEHAGTEYVVLLSLLGSFFYKEKYPLGASGQQPNKLSGSVHFTATGKRLGGRFLNYWRANGGLQQQGYPISDEFTERSQLDGKTYRVQYFERAVLELHPENAPPNDMLLSQLGTYHHKARYGGNSESRLTALKARPLTLPQLGQGEICPVSIGKVVAPQFGRAFGIGPVYAVIGASGRAEYNLSEATEEGGWYLLKTLWVAPPEYSGPTLVRGRQLDGGGELRFGPGPTPAASLELERLKAGRPTTAVPSWMDWPTYSRARTPGCYAFQIDGPAFSDVVVFRVVGGER